MKTTGSPVMKMPAFFVLQLLYPFPYYSLLEQVKHYDKNESLILEVAFILEVRS